MKTIHLITPIITPGLRSIDHISHLAGADLRFTQTILDRGPASIESEYDEALAAPDTIAKAIEAERAGADAIIIDCVSDPGLKPCREVVKIPVLGPGETSMHLAAMLGQKFSIVTVLDAVKPMATNQARIYGVYEKLASVRVVDVPVLDIHGDFAQTQRRLSEAAQQAVEQDGADVIVLGCTGFLGCAAEMQSHLFAAGYDIPVIDPIPATICVAEAIIKAGLRHSKRTYASPRPKTVIGFDVSGHELSVQAEPRKARFA